MTSRDELETRLNHFLEDLGKELPGRRDETAPHELRVLSALVCALQKDLRWLWEGPEMPGREKRSGDDDEYDWRGTAAKDVSGKNTFVRCIAWLDLFFSEHSEFMSSRLSPLYQLNARVSMALQELDISPQLWERVRKEKEGLVKGKDNSAPGVSPTVWNIFLTGYDEEKY